MCHNTYRVNQGHSDFEILQSLRGAELGYMLRLNTDRKSCVGIIRLNLNDIKGPFKSNLICLCCILCRSTCSYQPYNQPILDRLEYVSRIIVLVQISTISHRKYVKHVSAENVRGINARFYQNIPKVSLSLGPPFLGKFIVTILQNLETSFIRTIEEHSEVEFEPQGYL